MVIIILPRRPQKNEKVSFRRETNRRQNKMNFFETRTKQSMFTPDSGHAPGSYFPLTNLLRRSNFSSGHQQYRCLFRLIRMPQGIRTRTKHTHGYNKTASYCGALTRHKYQPAHTFADFHLFLRQDPSCTYTPALEFPGMGKA